MTFVRPLVDEAVSAPRSRLDAECRLHVPGQGLDARSPLQPHQVCHLLLLPPLQTIPLLRFFQGRWRKVWYLESCKKVNFNRMLKDLWFRKAYNIHTWILVSLMEVQLKAPSEEYLEIEIHRVFSYRQIAESNPSPYQWPTFLNLCYHSSGGINAFLIYYKSRGSDNYQRHRILITTFEWVIFHPNTAKHYFCMVKSNKCFEEMVIRCNSLRNKIKSVCWLENSHYH